MILHFLCFFCYLDNIFGCKKNCALIERYPELKWAFYDNSQKKRGKKKKKKKKKRKGKEKKGKRSKEVIDQKERGNGKKRIREGKNLGVIQRWQWKWKESNVKAVF